MTAFNYCLYIGSMVVESVNHPFDYCKQAKHQWNDEYLPWSELSYFSTPRSLLFKTLEITSFSFAEVHRCQSHVWFVARTMLQTDGKSMDLPHPLNTSFLTILLLICLQVFGKKLVDGKKSCTISYPRINLITATRSRIWLNWMN